MSSAVRETGALEGVRDLTLTTNGTQLAAMRQPSGTRA